MFNIEITDEIVDTKETSTPVEVMPNDVLTQELTRMVADYLTITSRMELLEKEKAALKQQIVKKLDEKKTLDLPLLRKKVQIVPKKSIKVNEQLAMNILRRKRLARNYLVTALDSATFKKHYKAGVLNKNDFKDCIVETPYLTLEIDELKS